MSQHLNILKEEPFISLSLVRHWDSLLDPVYEQGYLAESGFQSPYNKNPYPFPQSISEKRAKIAAKEGELTEEERSQLRRLNGEFDRTKWNRWGAGNYYRWCVEEA